MVSPGVDVLLALPLDERLELISVLWDSVVDESPAYPLSDEDRRELEQRLADYRRDPEAGAPWEEVRERLATIE